MADLDVSIEDNQLVIRGRQSDDDSSKIYLHRGIAGRQFQRSFVLAEGIEVKTAKLQDGLLHIDLSRPIPEPQVKKSKSRMVRRIPVSRARRSIWNRIPHHETLRLQWN